MGGAVFFNRKGAEVQSLSRTRHARAGGHPSLGCAAPGWAPVCTGVTADLFPLKTSAFSAALRFSRRGALYGLLRLCLAMTGGGVVRAKRSPLSRGKQKMKMAWVSGVPGKTFVPFSFKKPFVSLCLETLRVFVPSWSKKPAV